MIIVSYVILRYNGAFLVYWYLVVWQILKTMLMTTRNRQCCCNVIFLQSHHFRGLSHQLNCQFGLQMQKRAFVGTGSCSNVGNLTKLFLHVWNWRIFQHAFLKTTVCNIGQRESVSLLSEWQGSIFPQAGWSARGGWNSNQLCCACVTGYKSSTQRLGQLPTRCDIK